MILFYFKYIWTSCMTVGNVIFSKVEACEYIWLWSPHRPQWYRFYYTIPSVKQLKCFSSYVSLSIPCSVWYPLISPANHAHANLCPCAGTLNLQRVWKLAGDSNSHRDLHEWPAHPVARTQTGTTTTAFKDCCAVEKLPFYEWVAVPFAY